jgi:hypothetical protein
MKIHHPRKLSNSKSAADACRRSGGVLAATVGGKPTLQRRRAERGCGILRSPAAPVEFFFRRGFPQGYITWP